MTRSMILGMALVMASAQAVADTTPLVTTPTAKRSLTDATGAILSGDGIRARALLAAIPASELAPADLASRLCIIGRLDGRDQKVAPAVKDPFVRKLLTLYYRYWAAVETSPPANRPAIEAGLIKSVRHLLGPAAARDPGGPEALVAARFTRAGYYGITGRTQPFYDLMLWAGQEDRHYQVPLPGGLQDVRVVFLDNFASQGWSSYLSCARTGTGGWTKPDGIYAIRSGYPDLDSEHFKVNLLAHEAQHFQDGVRFPGLKSWELEYRAKLVEVIQADATREKVIRAFEVNQSDDPAASHSFANRRLLAALRRRLSLPADGDVRTAAWPTVQAAALAELNDDTAERQAKPAP